MTDSRPRRFRTIDAHTGGEPLRIIVEGIDEPLGDSMLSKRRWLEDNDDLARRLLMHEPRGHADMYGCLLTEPVTGDGDVGVLFLHNEGYSTMCGHGIIALTKVGLERGLFTPANPDEIRIDTPAGRVTAQPHWKPQTSGRRVAAVSFENVPSFVLHQQADVTVPGAGSVSLDVAFGGAFYAVVDATELDIDLQPSEAGAIIEQGRTIKRAVTQSLPVSHPTGEDDLDFVYGTIMVAPSERFHSRNVCVFADGEVDRSPTGTGVSARAAICAARGELSPGQSITIESLIGSTFDVRYERTLRLQPATPAIVPIVTGTAFVTGEHTFEVDPEDPLREGLFLR